MTAHLPDGYGLLTRRGVRGFAWVRAMGWLEETLARHGTLETWAAGAGSVELARGRGIVHARPAPVPGPDGSARWVCRHYRRGGRAGPLLGDRYLARGWERPFRELDASVAARDRGVRTPAVVAGAVYRSGFVYRADLVMEHVPEARSLADRLFDPSAGGVEEDLLVRAGCALRALELARIVHADASAGNILLARDSPAWIVDLDRCEVLPLEAPAPLGRMRRRLERSLRKIYASRGRQLAPSHWAALRAGYEGAT